MPTYDDRSCNLRFVWGKEALSTENVLSIWEVYDLRTGDFLASHTAWPTYQDVSRLVSTPEHAMRLWQHLYVLMVHQ